jgi:LysR family transcriptional regulator, low CO2-responsive transcriptional regulator
MVKLIILMDAIDLIGFFNGEPMNFKQLEVFLAVADSGSFSKGADATFITQSTVSQHISALEKELEIRLLDRTAKGALLTAAGETLLINARRVISEMRGIRMAISRLKGLEDVSLTAGASNIPGNYMIPEVLPVLQQRFPGLALTILMGDSRDIVRKIESEEVELGIVGSLLGDEALTFTPLGQDRIMLVVGRCHPWFSRTNAGLDELRSQSFIFREQGSGTGKTVSEALAAVGIDPGGLNVKVSLGSNEGIKHAVAGGAGISFVSELSVRRELAQGELREIVIPGLEIARQFYLVSRAGRELSPAAAAFAGVMLEKFK